MVISVRVYHLTKKENLYGDTGIASLGLIPQCGIRSKSINDSRIGVSFTNNYYTLKVWWIYLYPHTNIEDLCVLSFDIDKKDCKGTQNKTEFFVNKIIPAEKISIASFYNKKTNEEIPFHKLGVQAYNDYNWGEKPEPISICIKNEPITTLTKISKSK